MRNINQLIAMTSHYESGIIFIRKAGDSGQSAYKTDIEHTWSQTAD